MVKASEIHAETLLEEAEPDSTETETNSTPHAGQFDEYGLLATTEKSNVNIKDQPETQKLTYEEIESLKSDQLSNAKQLIARIMANHSQLDQKTAFSLAKYTIRKQKKYMKRFTLLPLDVVTLVNYMMEEKDFTKIMEIRNESLGLIGSWANVHAAAGAEEYSEPSCRYLVIDDTSGIVVASIAERMGILHHVQQRLSTDSEHVETAGSERHDDKNGVDIGVDRPQPRRPRYEHVLATSNTITVVHANQQPNLALLRYFDFDQTQTPSINDPSPHPLHTHLHALTWLQLLQPEADSTYSAEPQHRTPDELSTMKPNHRSNYYRKRRRWQRTRQVVNTTRAGGFDGLIIATYMDPVGVLKQLVPLLKGGAQVVVYAPNAEPLMRVCDVYSTARRAAYIQERRKLQSGVHEDNDLRDGSIEEKKILTDQMNVDPEQVGEDTRFPVDPTLLLTPALHHSCARQWQVLPGRTHPLMMGKGGAEGGYVLVTTRVIPLEGVVVQARGKPGRSKKSSEQDNADGKCTEGLFPVEQVTAEEPDSKRPRLETT